MINNPSPQDIQTLREVVRRVLRDPSTQIMHDVGINNQASDCFVALVPAGGIPPLDVLSGTSTADGDIPGSAICNLYRINHDFGATTGTSDDDYAELLAISGGQKRIYNLHSSPVTAKYVAVVKTKSGKWIVAGSGGSSTFFMEATSTITRPSSPTEPGSGTAKMKYRNPSTGFIEDYKPNGSVISATVYSMSVSIPNGELFEARSDVDYWVSKRLAATVYKGLTNGSFTSGSSSFAMDNLEAVNGFKKESSLATVYNTYRWSGDTNVLAEAEWNDQRQRWEGTMVACAGTATGTAL